MSIQCKECGDRHEKGECPMSMHPINHSLAEYPTGHEIEKSDCSMCGATHRIGYCDYDPLPKGGGCEMPRSLRKKIYGQSFSFDINDNVGVRLTEHGFKLHRAFIEDLNLPSTLEKKFEAPKCDDDGWYWFQLWELMQIFGKHLGQCGQLPFETEVQFKQGTKYEAT